jgi:hypothetical protein
MRFTAVTCFVAAVLAMTVAPAQAQWKSYVSRDLQFTFIVPGEVKAEKGVYKGERTGDHPAIIFRSTANNIEYTATVIDLSAPNANPASLLEEAVDYAGAYIAAKISAAPNALDLLDGLVDDYRHQLIRSDYRAGCPIVAVTVEAGDPDSTERSTKLIERTAAVFEHWTHLIGQRLVAEGVAASRAEELAMLVTTSIEGAIVIARAFRDVKPLDLVHHQLRVLLQAESAERNPRDDQ